MDVMKSSVCLLCLFTALVCAALLARIYLRTRSSFLFWSALCFSLLTINNLVLYLEAVVFPTQINLLPFRNFSSLAALGILLYGFIWDAD
jgi:hypothetical protein